MGENLQGRAPFIGLQRLFLKDAVDRLCAAGVDDVFVPAGDAEPPAGAYEGALPVLRRLGELGGPFAHLGITGCPESHPLIHDDLTVPRRGRP